MTSKCFVLIEPVHVEIAYRWGRNPGASAETRMMNGSQRRFRAPFYRALPHFDEHGHYVAMRRKAAGFVGGMSQRGPCSVGDVKKWADVPEDGSCPRKAEKRSFPDPAAAADRPARAPQLRTQQLVQECNCRSGRTHQQIPIRSDAE